MSVVCLRNVCALECIDDWLHIFACLLGKHLCCSAFLSGLYQRFDDWRLADVAPGAVVYLHQRGAAAAGDRERPHYRDEVGAVYRGAAFSGDLHLQHHGKKAAHEK